MSRFVLTVIMVLCSAATCCGAVHRALVFGLGKQLDTRWAKINGDNDMHYVVNMLQDMGFTDIATLRNEQATKANMVKAYSLPPVATGRHRVYTLFGTWATHDRP